MRYKSRNPANRQQKLTGRQKETKSKKNQINSSSFVTEVIKLKVNWRRFSHP